MHVVDHDIATGVWPDMTEHGWVVDEWPRIQDAGGFPASGNQRSEWDAGARFDFENPEYR